MKICPRCMRQFDDDDVEECPDDGTRLRTFQDSQSQIMGVVLDDRWKIEEKIGEGGMGEVYRARQVNVDRVVAIKVLRLALASSEQYVARFFREADIATSVQHPHFVTIYDFGQTSSQLLYLAMELLEGESLGEVLKERRLSLQETLTIAAQVCAALAAAHDARIVHRDLKPDNIFLIDVTEGETFVKVLDFGIAKDLDSGDKVTKTGQLFGTPEYMSPEQCEGSHRVDGRSDLYALGCILYELLTGRSPCQRESIIKTLLAQVSDRPKSFEELGIPVPSGVREIVMKLLEKHPDNRYGDAIEVRDALLAELDRLRDNSGEIHVYETVSATIKPRGRSAQTVSYSDLAHPLQLEGVLASSARSAIQKEAASRREAESEKSTENVELPAASPNRWPLLAIAAAVAILGSYAAFGGESDPRPTAEAPTTMDLQPVQAEVAAAVAQSVTSALSQGAAAQARRAGAAIALRAATLGLGPRAVAAVPKKAPRDPSHLKGGTGIRTQSSMRARVLAKELALLQCYDKRENTADGGQVKFVFFIEADGTARSVNVSSTSLKSQKVLDCMKKTVAGLRFYDGSGGARFETNLNFKSAH